MGGTSAQTGSAGYDALGEHYDRYTAHPGYDAWLASVLALATRHGDGGKRVLEVGCGTGKALPWLRAHGYTVTACDASEAMLAVARTRAAPGQRVLCLDATALPRLGAFDVVLMLNDVANCLLDLTALTAAMAGLAANLRPGGVCVFDVNALSVYRGVFAETHTRRDAGTTFRWTGHETAAFGSGAVARASLEVTPTHGPPVHSPQVQRHHPEADVRGAVADAGLVLAGVYGQALDGTPAAAFDPDLHDKAIHVVTQP